MNSMEDHIKEIVKLFFVQLISVCGLQNKDDRIVGGEDAKMNEFPWQVAIVTAGTRAPICGGSKSSSYQLLILTSKTLIFNSKLHLEGIINSRYVLTAAHW